MALKSAHQKQLWNDRQWLKLLHYHTTVWTRKLEGQADGPEFYLAPDGKSNPQSEMEATLRGFFDPRPRQFKDKVSQSIYCQFPARFRFLSQHLNFKDLPKQNCHDFNKWYSKLKPKSVTLVFSSYFMNNPASTFGHSLIRINQSDASQANSHSELLDYGINYAAVMTTENPILYAINGLMGFFPGVFTALPYYYKVREYNDFENRDLWEYDLNLTPQEVQMLVAHFWELGSTSFDYYYVTENCAFHMLTALEAAAPRLHLTDPLPFWTIPSDTLKALTQTEGLIKKITFRPSLWSQLNARLRQLKSAKEHNFLKEVLKTKTLPQNFDELAPKTQASILDAAMDAIDYKWGRELISEDPKFVAWKQNLLVARSQLPPSEPLVVTPPIEGPPHISHGSMRIGLTYWTESLGSVWEPSVRFALHDLLDPPHGYPPFAKIDFFSFRFRYAEPNSQFILEHFFLFDLASLSPWQSFDKKFSWRIQLGLERLRDQRCNQCLTAVLRTAGGVTWSWNPWLSQFVMGEVAGHYHSDFPGADASLTLSPLTGLHFQYGTHLRALAELRLNTIFHNQTHLSYRDGKVNFRYSPNLKYALDVGYQWTIDGRHLNFTVLTYF